MGLARKQRKAFYTKHAKAPLGELATPALDFARRHAWPLSDWEKEIEAEALDHHRDRRPLFHGGISGLGVGARILPGAATGMNSHGLPDADWRRSRVYTTPTLSRARLYAQHVAGSVYRVSPEGTIGLDVFDVRMMAILMGSPQFEQMQRLTGGSFRSRFLSALPVTLTADSAIVLEVLP